MSIVVKPNSNFTFGVYQRIKHENVGWKWLKFEARMMKKGHEWTHQTGTDELVIVLLGGKFKVSSNRGSWETINARKNIFCGIVHTLYLPPSTQFKLTATSDTLYVGYGWCFIEGSFGPKFVKPASILVVILTVLIYLLFSLLFISL